MTQTNPEGPPSEITPEIQRAKLTTTNSIPSRATGALTLNPQRGYELRGPNIQYLSTGSKSMATTLQIPGIPAGPEIIIVLLTTVLSLIVPLLLFYFIWSIHRNIRRIANDVESVRERIESERDG